MLSDDSACCPFQLLFLSCRYSRAYVVCRLRLPYRDEVDEQALIDHLRLGEPRGCGADGRAPCPDCGDPPRSRPIPWRWTRSMPRAAEINLEVADAVEMDVLHARTAEIHLEVARHCGDGRARHATGRVDQPRSRPTPWRWTRSMPRAAEINHEVADSVEMDVLHARAQHWRDFSLRSHCSDLRGSPVPGAAAPQHFPGGQCAAGMELTLAGSVSSPLSLTHREILPHQPIVNQAKGKKAGIPRQHASLRPAARRLPPPGTAPGTGSACSWTSPGS